MKIDLENKNVIDNSFSGGDAVIDNKISGQRAEFDRYAEKLRMVIAVKQADSGQAGAFWWLRLPESLRMYLLYEVAPDDFERYAATGWPGLPSGLRSALWLETQKTLRFLQACPSR